MSPVFFIASCIFEGDISGRLFTGLYKTVII